MYSYVVRGSAGDSFLRSHGVFVDDNAHKQMQNLCHDQTVP